MTNTNHQQGFVLVFVIAVVAALSLMTASMNFYYDNALKSTTRNSVYQQIKLASESGVQSAKTWLLDELNKDQFSLLDIQNDYHIDNANNKCLNRHGYTDSTKDIHFTKWIKGDLGTDSKFKDIKYEVFVQRYADRIKSLYFTGTGVNGSSFDRSAAYVRKFKDFPNTQFTVEMWIKNMHQDDDTYNMHAWEWGREWDVVFKVWRVNASDPHAFSPRLGNFELANSPGESSGDPVLREWTHLAWVWDGGNSTGNVRIYQNGQLTGTWDASIPANYSTSYSVNNSANQLADSDNFPLAIGMGTKGFLGDGTAETGDVDFQGVPWLGNITEVRFWSNSRTAQNIRDNFRTRLTGSEPNLVSYYKFNEGSGSTVKDYNTSRPAANRNDLTVLGLSLTGDQQTKWQEDFAKYPLVTNHDEAPMINVPPGEDIAYYRILSCGIGPDGQILPLTSIVSSPVIQGDIGTEGEVGFDTSDFSFSSTTVPNYVEFSFYDNGSDQSIYMSGEDSLSITNIPSGWSVTQNFNGNSTPLKITPATGITLDQFKEGLANVFYKSCGKEQDCSQNPKTYTPGKRRIKLWLKYTNTSLNEEFAFTKSLSAREKVILTPVSWQIK